MNTTTTKSASSYIAGEWADAENASLYNTTDPGRSGTTVASYSLATSDDVQRAIMAAHGAAPGWAATTANERMELIYALLEKWPSRQSDMAEIATREMGKVFSESLGESSRAVMEMRFWAGEALRLGDRTFSSVRSNTDAYSIRQPIGPVAAITPWNFPILTPIRKIIPALVCGCPVILKPALQSPGASVIMAELLDEIGVPPGVFNLLIGAGREIGDALVNSPDIAGVTFTGSTDVGLGIATTAARRNARTQLEMGGKNAAVVSSATDVERVATEIATAAFTAAGQRCTAISRVIVTEDLRSRLEEALVRQARTFTVGYGLDEASRMGPLVNTDQFTQVQRYVEQAIDDGAKVLLGGQPLKDPELGEGNYYPATVVTDVEPGSPLATEEVFGPVLAVIPVADFDQAIAVANETRYGLTSAVFTDNMDLAHRFVTEVRSGMVHVNHGTTSEGHVPFGGVAQSGQGAYGIGDTSKDFFTNLKIVYQVYGQ
ncbi:aldehyde dehydrogenase family protein [Nesterenkonia sandarakina]|uniref:Aldehyde dehydrogenase (NAD+) n=1 Tax=Nesterenkonia sandarakina TaxID=272918 RepID=A0A2T0YAR2_9MICC|nr:aldehyde dehydrogenase family protein [Nesterenkonia sandarakina]PRZ11758.1 aldehyde dehydrogenase (NAD+) [Nesterenkonia sandarakina]